VVSLDFSVTYSFRPYHGPGVDSAPGENEYQEHSWGWRQPKCEVDLTTFMCRMWKSGSVNLLEPSGPHQACYGTALPLPFIYKTMNTVVLTGLKNPIICQLEFH